MGWSKMWRDSWLPGFIETSGESEERSCISRLARIDDLIIRSTTISISDQTYCISSKKTKDK